MKDKLVVYRTNDHGLKFVIIEESLDTISVKLCDKVITINTTMAVFLACWYKWQVKEMFIQDAFPNLNANEREFLMTGITSEEWGKIFNSENENDCE